MDSIKIRIRDPRKQLPAEEPRSQPVHPPWPEAVAAKAVPKDKDGAGGTV